MGCLRDIPHESKGIMPNQVAANQLWEDERAYRKQALEWAIKDNSGYGMVQFQDLRLAAIQSCLLVPNAMPYECHIFCKGKIFTQKTCSIQTTRVALLLFIVKTKSKSIIADH